MKEVRVRDRVFIEAITEENIQARIADICRQLNRDYEGNIPLVVSVLNGAFVFTSDLVRQLEFDPEVQFVRLSSWHGGMESTGKVRKLLDLHVDIEGRDILIVEDIVDTGNTLEWLRNYLKGKGAKSVKIVCLLFKEEMFEKDVPPEYYCFRIPNEFVVGYGLDYGEMGRSLRSIYKLKE